MEPEPQSTEQQQEPSDIPTQSNVRLLRRASGSKEAKKLRKRTLSKKKHHHRHKEMDTLSNFKYDMPGVTRIVLSEKTQQNIGLVVGEDVTSENPWKMIRKEVIEDHIELMEESEFKPLRLEVLPYPRPCILMGYAPDESKDYDEFFMVLSERAEDIINDVIKRIKELQDSRLARALSVVPKGYWGSYGSEAEIDEYTEKQNRPLYEVEIETAYPIISPKVHFKLRPVNAARDGYAELLQGRMPIASVLKKRIHAAIQVSPAVVQREAQTICTYPKNAWTQYFYEYSPVNSFTPEFEKNLNFFVNGMLNHLLDSIRVNDHINLYTNDYVGLITDPEYAQAPQKVSWEEYMSFADLKDARNKMITSACWHPMWTGTIAISYADRAPNTYSRHKSTLDPVNIIVHGINPILVWCFNDGLYPKLQLECHRPVDVISFCPFDENLIVGGLSNGQVVLWDIRNKINKVEEEEILTTAQQKYRVLMFSLMDWFKNVKNIKYVRVTAQSDQLYSHSRNVTRINWLSRFKKMTKTGQLLEIPEGEPLSLQFCTSSIDGTLLYWDLLAKPQHGGTEYRPQKKLRRLKVRPSALTLDVSPFRGLNRLLRPHYRLSVFHEKKKRALPISSSDIFSEFVYYEKVDPKQQDTMLERVIYRPIVKRPAYQPLREAICGTSNGYVFLTKWEGYDVNPGEVINQETTKLTSIGRYHDGPVHSLDRNASSSDTYLSVGGRVFAIWRTDFKNRPILWRKSRVRYLHGHWAKGNPSTFRLSRRDGNREVWNLLKRTDKLYYEQNLSGERVLGSYVHPRNLPVGVLGIADNNGAFRMFYVPNTANETETEKQLKFMLDREVIRKKAFTEWQSKWLKNNAHIVEEKLEHRRKKREKMIERELKEQQRLIEEKVIQEKEQKVAEKKNIPQPGHYREWAQEQWKIKEEERMKKVLLMKKQLNPHLLVSQQMPLKELEREEEKKKKKQKERLGESEKIFTDTVAMLFPDVIKTKPPPPLNPYAGGYSDNEKGNCFDEFRNLAADAECFIGIHPFVYNFDWKRVVQQGIDRRRDIQSQYVTISHKERMAADRRMTLPSEEGSKIDVNKIISKPSVTDVNEEDEEDAEEQQPHDSYVNVNENTE